ncbi:MAG: glycine dehydrogenase (aminomethyl-transferring) [Ignavibacteriales bacterium CG07_land_8_20_14_0_80_59_12]|nr:MAG: glycine dehydrogenase (aminomethyl-transferring) [Ignavibacteriales bacterium CG07_land_8_20_14_0_80_59_12]
MLEPLIYERSRHGRRGATLPALDVPEQPVDSLIPRGALRTEGPRLPEVSENEVVRHFINLSSLNYHLDRGIYPLGSCTMKYNPKMNEVAAAMPGFQHLHPLTPESHVQGALRLMYELGEMLKEINGMAGISLQPAAGAHGELTGLMMIRKYFESRGEQRHVILVPDSAHGTNPASSVIGGFTTASVKSNAEGTIDLDDLKAHLASDVAAIMLTNPNTLGIFERDIVEIEKLLHGNGSLMYMDGANLNALLGITRPGDHGFDVMHINLHKTFSTPHGGGGPGAGPVAVNSRLEPFLPRPVIEKHGDRYVMNWNRPLSIGKVQTFFGNFGVIVRAYAYIRANGAKGLSAVSRGAILNANYLLSRLRGAFELPYGTQPLHEFVLSASRQKEKGVRALDIAKRLLDYGVHAPTAYFPLIVHEALMIEPTETETKESLDYFAHALLEIDKEIETNKETVLNAPHTTPVRRLDEVRAAKQLNVKYVPGESSGDSGSVCSAGRPDSFSPR